MGMLDQMADKVVGSMMASIGWERRGSDPSFRSMEEVNARLETMGNSKAVAAVIAAENLLVGTLASLPREVRRNGEVVTDHPLVGLLESPSRYLDRHQVWDLLFRGMVRGNGFGIVIRNGGSDRRPLEIVPAVLSNFRYGNTGMPEYDLSWFNFQGRPGAVNATSTYQASSVLGFHWYGFNGLLSPSPLAFAAKSATDMARAVQAHLANRLDPRKNLGQALTVDLEMNNSIDPEQMKALTRLTKASFKVAQERGGIPLLPPGIEISKESFTGVSSADTQLIDILRWGVEDIARAYLLSPVRLGQYMSGVRVSGFKDQAADFERYSIANLSETIDAQFNRKLRIKSDIKDGYYIATNTEGIRLGSIEDLAATASLLVADAGIWTINEGRALTGKSAVEGGDRLMSPRGAPPQASAVGPPLPPTPSGEDEGEDEDGLEGANEGKVLPFRS